VEAVVNVNIDLHQQRPNSNMTYYYRGSNREQNRTQWCGCISNRNLRQPAEHVYITPRYLTRVWHTPASDALAGKLSKKQSAALNCRTWEHENAEAAVPATHRSLQVC
jgi:hypothetical protein